MRSRWGFSLLLEVLLLACILSAAACSRATTSAKLRDPSKVSMSLRRLGQSSLRPINEGSGDFTSDLRGFGVEQPGSLRKENGAIVLECASCIDGNLQLLSEKGATAPADMSVKEILESRESNRRKMKLGYEYEVSGDDSLFPELETSWSNIDYYDQTNEPIHELGWALVPGVFLMVAGVLVMALEEDAAAGLAMSLPGLAVAVFGGYHLVKSPTTERFGPDGQPRQAPPPVIKKEPKEEKPDLEPEAEPKPKDDLAEEPAEEKAKEPKPEPEKKEVEKEEEPAPVKKVEKKEKKVEKKEKKAKKKGKKDEGLDDFLL
jgi:hypothetical protein